MSCSRRLPWWLAGLHLLVLWAFAVAQPLFDLLGKNGEFFAARGSTRWDVVLFAFVLLFVPPAILLGLEALIGRSRADGRARSLRRGARSALFVLQAIRERRRSGLAARRRRGRDRAGRGARLPARGREPG